MSFWSRVGELFKNAVFGEGVAPVYEPVDLENAKQLLRDYPGLRAAAVNAAGSGDPAELVAGHLYDIISGANDEGYSMKEPEKVAELLKGRLPATGGASVTAGWASPVSNPS